MQRLKKEQEENEIQKLKEISIHKHPKMPPNSSAYIFEKLHDSAVSQLERREAAKIRKKEREEKERIEQSIHNKPSVVPHPELFQKLYEDGARRKLRSLHASCENLVLEAKARNRVPDAKKAEQKKRQADSVERLFGEHKIKSVKIQSAQINQILEEKAATKPPRLPRLRRPLSPDKSPPIQLQKKFPEAAGPLVFGSAFDVQGQVRGHKGSATQSGSSLTGRIAAPSTGTKEDFSDILYDASSLQTSDSGNMFAMRQPVGLQSVVPEHGRNRRRDSNFALEPPNRAVSTPIRAGNNKSAPKSRSPARQKAGPVGGQRKPVTPASSQTLELKSVGSSAFVTPKRHGITPTRRPASKNSSKNSVGKADKKPVLLFGSSGLNTINGRLCFDGNSRFPVGIYDEDEKEEKRDGSERVKHSTDSSSWKDRPKARTKQSSPKIDRVKQKNEDCTPWNDRMMSESSLNKARIESSEIEEEENEMKKFALDVERVQRGTLEGSFDTLAKQLGRQEVSKLSSGDSVVGRGWKQQSRGDAEHGTATRGGDTSGKHSAQCVLNFDDSTHNSYLPGYTQEVLQQVQKDNAHSNSMLRRLNEESNSRILDSSNHSSHQVKPSERGRQEYLFGSVMLKHSLKTQERGRPAERDQRLEGLYHINGQVCLSPVRPQHRETDLRVMPDKKEEIMTRIHKSLCQKLGRPPQFILVDKP
eukprot:Platyproteum_vivax@DN12322_c0_g1_i1.p1